jgi:hypothetical protein
MGGTVWRPKTLERLDSLIQDTRSDKEKRILLVKKACALARFSRLDEAGGILQRVRGDGSAYDPRLSAWVTFCQGLMEHFGTLSERAIRAFRRAYAVGVSVGDLELAAIASAWIANAEYAAGHLAAVPAALVQTFTYADPNNASARSRAYVVIADLYHLAGDAAKARAWYKRARDAAVDDGDVAMQSVAMYNDASFRVSKAVLDDCHGQANEHDVMLASVAVDSVANLDLGLGVRHLTSMVPLLRAEIRAVQRRWDEAIGLFEVFLGDRSVEANQRMMPKYRSELAYCFAMTDDCQAALQAISAAVEATEACADFDDLVVLHSRAASVYERLAMHDACNLHRASAARCLTAFNELQSDLMTSIEATVSRIEQLEKNKNPAAAGF